MALYAATRSVSRSGFITQVALKEFIMADRVGSDAQGEIVHALSVNGEHQFDVSVTRRRFLAGAALGLPALAVPGVAFAQTSSSHSVAQARQIGVEAFEGTLVSLTADLLELDIAGNVHMLPVTSATTFWKGGETRASDLRAEDHVLV